MKVELILPALTEATSPFCRPIKYSLFAPLGLATLAAYLEEATTADVPIVPLLVGRRGVPALPDLDVAFDTAGR